MNNKNTTTTYLSFNHYLKKQLKNPEFKRHYEEYNKQLQIAYQIVQMRKRKKMSQIELARKMNTKQSNIARMESGQQNFTVDTLQKIASVFDCDVRIKFVG